jgi:hypothetical protein
MLASGVSSTWTAGTWSCIYWRLQATLAITCTNITRSLRLYLLRHKRTILWLAVATVAMIIVVTAVVVYTSQTRKRIFLTTSSPGGIYKVVLSGEKQRPWLPMIDHSVFLTALKNEKTLVSNQEIYRGDSLDAGFDDWYPEHQWVTEQSMQFYRDEFRRDRPNDNVTVQNDSTKRIKYLKITSIDILIILELDPRSTAEYSVSRARQNLKWFSVDGQFESGQPIIGASKDFDRRKKTGPFSFQISVSDTATTITGPFKG